MAEGVVVKDNPKPSGIGAEIAATLAEDMLEYLTAPVNRVAAPNTPAPFSPAMERFYVPDAFRVAQAARQVVAF